MDINSLLFIIFLSSSFFFSGVEASFLSLDRVVINRFEHSKNIIHIIITFFLKKFDLFIISLLFFNLLNNIFAVSLGKVVLQEKFGIVFDHWVKEFFFILFSTLILLIFCEITPKRLGIKFSKSISIFSVPIMLPVFFIFYPISIFYKYFTKRFINLFQKKKDKSKNINKTDFISFIKRSSDAGAIKEIESHMLQQLIHYKDTPIKSVLIPRLKMKALNINKLPEKLQKEIIKFPYNTIPVFENVKDNVIGVLSKKKLFYNANIHEITKSNIKKMLDIPEIFPESKTIMDTLVQMQKNNTELCLITDEYGGIEGMATYVDLVKKLLGKIESNEPDVEKIKRIPPNSFRVNPSLPLSEFNSYFGVDIHCEMAETIGGYLTEINHNIPQAGEIINDTKMIYTIKQSNKKKILKLVVKRI